MTDRCKYCQAEIRWAKTSNGKAIPLNVEKGALVWVEEPYGDSVRVRQARQAFSHLATCPHYRRPKQTGTGTTRPDLYG